MSDEIKIEKGVPMSKKLQPGSRSYFRKFILKLEMGDSFVLTKNQRGTMGQVIRSGLDNKEGISVSCTKNKLDGSYRCWRVK